MEETVFNKTRSKYLFLMFFEIAILPFLLTVSISDAGTFVYITNSGDNNVSVIDTSTNTVTATVNVGKLPFKAAASPDGNRVYVVNYLGNSVSAIDTATNTVIATVNVGSLPFGAAVSTDGNKLYVANFASNNISVIDTLTNKVTVGINAGKCPWDIALSLDGKKLYAANLNSNTVSVISTTTNSIVSTVKVGNNPWGVAVSPDGKKAFVTNSGSNTVSVIDTTTDTVVDTVNVGIGPWGVAVSPDGEKLYVTNSDSNSVSVIETLTNNVVTTVNVGRLPCGVTLNPEGKRAYVVNSDSNNISIINTATNTITDALNVGSLPVGMEKIVVPVSPSLPIADFSGDLSSGQVPLTVQFTDLSKNVKAWKWDFGDGTGSIQQNPIHTYSTAGTYTVILTASNENGTDFKSATIKISEKITPVFPVANFSTNVSYGYAPLSIQFTDLSENTIGHKWDFGDGENSTDQNPVHTYNIAGNFTVNLVVRDYISTGYKSAMITVLEKPEPAFPVSDYNSSLSSSFVPTDVRFTDTSQDASGESSGRTSGGGAGGGAGGSPEPQNNVETKELSQTFIASGNCAKFDFLQKVTAVVSISLNSKKTAGKTTTIVETLKAKSILVSVVPSGEVYKYLNIWVGNSGFATPKNIENAVVNFKVAKSWVQEMKIDKSSITLNRYSDKTWTSLLTSFLSEDDNYLYFTASTPGFSPFAITGKIAAPKEDTYKTQPQSSNQRVEQNNTSKIIRAKEVFKQKEKASIQGFEIIYGVIGLLGVFLYRRK